MKNTIICFLFLSLVSCSVPSEKDENNFVTLFEKSEGTATPEYAEVINYYQDLAKQYPQISLFEFGETDSGKPLHLVVYNGDENLTKDKLRESAKNRVLINNGIHPGESDGIDASMLLLRDIVQSDSLQKKYQNTLIAIIPIYNIGGSLNRNSHTRANQNGPVAYGFRGNARNYDLNRDFIKQDSKNAAAFASIFHALNPDVFVDNHVSNGADYQYAITHLFTQHNKLGGKLGTFLETEMRPHLEKSLTEKGILITPYVNVWGTTPESGFSQFFDSPRYSTGYTTLFNSLGLMVETHMLKPYKTRVIQTYELLFSTLDFTEEYATDIKKLRANAAAAILAKKTYPISYTVDRENPTELQFKGYEAAMIASKVTNGKRLFYDTTKPFTKPTKYYNNFEVAKEVVIPKAYVIPQGWHEVIDRLRTNKIEFEPFKRDTIIAVTVNHVADYKTRTVAYEGHYLHYNTSVSSSNEEIAFKKGDIYIPTAQSGVRYLLETLEAAATDSFFNWNFFDTVLQQKEGYSAYVFEDIAATFLAENPSLKEAFEEELKTDKDFAKNANAQLNWIYKQSPHYEKAHLRLPVFKIYE